MWYFNVHIPEATSLKNGSCKRFLIEGYDVGSLHASTEIIDWIILSKMEFSMNYDIIFKYVNFLIGIHTEKTFGLYLLNESGNWGGNTSRPSITAVLYDVLNTSLDV